MTSGAPVVPRVHVAAASGAMPHRFGLFSAATILENADPHELGGIEYEAVTSTRVDGWPAPGQPGAPPSGVKTPYPTSSVVVGTPFAVFAAVDDLLGHDEPMVRAQLRQRFLCGEQAAVERIVRTGEFGNWPHLASASVLVPDAPGVDLCDAVGLLEQWLAETLGGTGVLHAPRTIAPRLAQALCMVVSGPTAQTVLGSTWALGTGFTGGPPNSEGTDHEVDDGSLWLYATGPVTIRRSALIEPATWTTGAVDRATNRALLVEERIYVVDWPTTVAAVRVSAPSAGMRPGWAPASMSRSSA
ncbi:hypothetical protein GCM10010174_03230 [Kutzneria viridogrisea]|uniref:Uncharacterized protein n=1 Tax=Kutzneria viridogrisea TaxID=47990 RepID=A0ABR6BR93_9PSEU|nr:hypothetical protein [Kutzneria viridogrisea]